MSGPTIFDVHRQVDELVAKRLKDVAVQIETQRAAARQMLAALTAIIAMLRKEAPGTPLNNHRFDALGIQAYNAIAAAERAGIKAEG